jgi:hypothetical protein
VYIRKTEAVGITKKYNVFVGIYIVSEGQINQSQTTIVGQAVNETIVDHCLLFICKLDIG